MRDKFIKSKKFFVLSRLCELGSITVESFFPRQYKFTRPSRKLLGFENNHDDPRTYDISAVLSKLKQEGLVKRDGTKKQSVWTITPRGQQKLKNINEDNLRSEQETPYLQLVIFDIPEKDKKKRSWLRYQLIMLNYKMLQKSVWVGKTSLSEKFIKELHSLNLQNNIHIFGVHKTGTLLK